MSLYTPLALYFKGTVFLYPRRLVLKRFRFIWNVLTKFWKFVQLVEQAEADKWFQLSKNLFREIIYTKNVFANILSSFLRPVFWALRKWHQVWKLGRMYWELGLERLFCKSALFNTFAGNATVLIYLPFAKTKIFAMIKLLEKKTIENFKYCRASK